MQLTSENGNTECVIYLAIVHMQNEPSYAVCVMIRAPYPGIIFIRDIAIYIERKRLSPRLSNPYYHTLATPTKNKQHGIYC